MSATLLTYDPASLTFNEGYGANFTLSQGSLQLPTDNFAIPFGNPNYPLQMIEGLPSITFPLGAAIGNTIVEDVSCNTVVLSLWWSPNAITPPVATSTFWGNQYLVFGFDGADLTGKTLRILVFGVPNNPPNGAPLVVSINQVVLTSPLYTFTNAVFNFIVSANLPSGAVQLAINDNVLPVTNLFNNVNGQGFIPYGASGFPNNAVLFPGKIAGIFYDEIPGTFDLTIVANRRKFIDANLQPANIGSAGVGVFNRAPLYYFTGSGYKFGPAYGAPALDSIGQQGFYCNLPVASGVR